MADRQQWRTSQYNPLGSAEPDELSVQTDTQGFHEIKIYNMVRDKMWELYSQMVLSNTPEEIIATAEQIQIILLRADSIWNGIQASANLKASNLGIQKSKHFVYGGQMKILSHEVKKYVNFYEHPSMFIDKYNRYNEEFALFINNTDDGKMQFLKDKLETIVTNVDSTWGELASKIGMSLPLKIAEEKELFFRGR